MDSHNVDLMYYRYHSTNKEPYQLAAQHRRNNNAEHKMGLKFKDRHHVDRIVLEGNAKQIKTIIQLTLFKHFRQQILMLI